MENDKAVITNNKNTKRKKLLFGMSSFFLIIGLIWLFYWLHWGRYEETTDDAYVNGNVVQLTSQLSGAVAAIYGDDTALIRQGLPIIQLDNTDYRLQLDQAEAELARAVRNVEQLFANDLQLQSDITLRTTELNKAKDDLKRRQHLTKDGTISAEELKHKETDVTLAHAALTETKHHYQANHALIANTTLESNPLVLTAAAKYREAYVNYSRTSLLAPVTGYIAKRNVQIGQKIMAGAPLLAIVPLHQLWVDANFKESELTNIRIGQPVTLISDLYGNSVKFHGTVEGLSPGTGSAFALLPPQNASGNWIKIVQRVPVRIRLNSQEINQHPLRLGLSMRVTVSTHERSGFTLMQVPVSRPTYFSSVYNKQFEAAEKEADTKISALIKANQNNT